LSQGKIGIWGWVGRRLMVTELGVGRGRGKGKGRGRAARSRMAWWMPMRSSMSWCGGCARKSMATPRGRGRGCSVPIHRHKSKQRKQRFHRVVSRLCLVLCGRLGRGPGYGDGSDHSIFTPLPQNRPKVFLRWVGYIIGSSCVWYGSIRCPAPEAIPVPQETHQARWTERKRGGK
jgi:hypothetical protein